MLELVCRQALFWALLGGCKEPTWSLRDMLPKPPSQMIRVPTIGRLGRHVSNFQAVSCGFLWCFGANVWKQCHTRHTDFHHQPRSPRTAHMPTHRFTTAWTHNLARSRSFGHICHSCTAQAVRIKIQLPDSQPLLGLWGPYMSINADVAASGGSLPCVVTRVARLGHRGLRFDSFCPTVVKLRQDLCTGV
jgi:hypothetical protein